MSAFRERGTSQTLTHIDPAAETIRPLDSVLSDDARREFNRIVFQFEDAWQRDTAPDISQFLPEGQPLRQVLLHELIKIDFEYRFVKGEPADLATYQTRFAELSADPRQLQNLVTWFNQFSAEQRQTSAPRPAVLESDYWSSIKPGTVLGNYKILELIGHGGMGAVFKAQHQRMNRVIALKTITPLASRSGEAIQRFHREVRAAARLDHPNIVTAHDADKFGEFHVLVMQYVDGRDLSTQVKQQGPLSVNDALDCITQAARGLEYAHKNGVIHRDIKPSNLIRNRDGQLKILDMGLARIEQSLNIEGEEGLPLTVPGQIVGTADFMSPEQASNAKLASAQSDVYSLGCTLYFLLTGRIMYGGKTFMYKILAHLESATPRLQDARTDIPDWLEHVFQRMVAKKPEDRFQTMTQILQALQQGPALLPTVPKVPSTSEVDIRPEISSSRFPWTRWNVRVRIVAVLIAAAVVLLVIGYMVLR